MTTSNVFYETVLPSGRAVRFTPLKTRQKLEIEKRVEAMKGDSTSLQVQTVASCLKAYTAPLTMVYKPREDGTVPTPADATVEDEVDIDAMLDAASKQWHQVTFQDLVTEGETHCLDLFDSLPDWASLWGAIAARSGWGEANTSLLSGKARAGSVAL